MPIITIYRHFNPNSDKYFRDINTVLQRIKDGKSAHLVERAQLAYGDKVAYANAKKQLPAILFSGQFEHRSIKGLIKHSGFICLDFDKFPDESTMQLWRDTLESDEYTYCVFTSPSGYGLKVLVRIPAPESDIYRLHKAYFMGLKSYYGCEYFDSTVFDVSRICFESYDPELQINPSRVWVEQVFDPPPVQVEYAKASLSEQETARRLLKWADRKFPIVSGSRNSNLFRLCAAFNDYGINFDYARSLVSAFQSEDFKLSEIDTTLKSAYRKTGKFGTLKF